MRSRHTALEEALAQRTVVQETPPVERPTVAIVITGPGITFDLQVVTDLPTARTIVDAAFHELIHGEVSG